MIINSVTAIEVYFKDILKTLPEVNPELKKGDGIKELLRNKEKANFWDAWEIFSDRGYRLGDILIYFYSFQNLDEINHVFSKVLGLNDFLKTINALTIELVDWESDFYSSNTLCLRKNYPMWIQKLNELFQLRHNYTHHIAFKDVIGESRVFDLYFNACAFIKIADTYIFDNYVPE